MAGIKPIEEQQIACEICMREVPISEAKSAEAEDYVLHFCGLDCYAAWRQQRDTDEAAARRVTATGQ